MQKLAVLGDTTTVNLGGGRGVLVREMVLKSRSGVYVLEAARHSLSEKNNVNILNRNSDHSKKIEELSIYFFNSSEYG